MTVKDWFINHIEWDTEQEDGERPSAEALGLPDKVYFTGTEDEMADHLSDTYGYCVFQFQYQQAGGEAERRERLHELPPSVRFELNRTCGCGAAVRYPRTECETCELISFAMIHCTNLPYGEMTLAQAAEQLAELYEVNPRTQALLEALRRYPHWKVTHSREAGVCLHKVKSA